MPVFTSYCIYYTFCSLLKLPVAKSVALTLHCYLLPFTSLLFTSFTTIVTCTAFFHCCHLLCCLLLLLPLLPYWSLLHLLLVFRWTELALSFTFLHLNRNGTILLQLLYLPLLVLFSPYPSFLLVIANLEKVGTEKIRRIGITATQHHWQSTSPYY